MFKAIRCVVVEIIAIFEEVEEEKRRESRDRRGGDFYYELEKFGG